MKTTGTKTTICVSHLLIRAARRAALDVIPPCFILLAAAAGFGLALADDEDKSTPAGQEQAVLGFDARIVGTYEPGITPPKILVQTIPGYTGEARSSDPEGTVILVCVIRRTGRADSLLVERHPGQRLQEGVIREISDDWKFVPATAYGRPVDVLAKIALIFDPRASKYAISLSKAEGLSVEGIQLVDLSEQQATRARAAMKMQESAKFQKAAFASDVETLKEKFGLMNGTVFKGNSGGVVIKYRFSAEPR